MDLQDDRSFGAVVSFGVGGVATKLLGDRAYAVVPLTAADASALISGPRAAPLLTGYDGEPPADTSALAELALRVSALSDELPEVVELPADGRSRAVRRIGPVGHGPRGAVGAAS